MDHPQREALLNILGLGETMSSGRADPCTGFPTHLQCPSLTQMALGPSRGDGVTCYTIRDASDSRNRQFPPGFGIPSFVQSDMNADERKGGLGLSVECQERVAWG